MADRTTIEAEVGAPALEAFFHELAAELAGSRVWKVPGFGRFGLFETEGLVIEHIGGPNPDMREVGPGRRWAVFHPDPGLKNALNEGAPMPELSPVPAAICRRLAAGETADLAHWGAFALRQRRAFLGHNPKTGAPFQVPARTLVEFKTGPALQACLGAPPPSIWTQVPIRPREVRSLPDDLHALADAATTKLLDRWARRLVAALAGLATDPAHRDALLAPVDERPNLWRTNPYEWARRADALAASAAEGSGAKVVAEVGARALWSVGSMDGSELDNHSWTLLANAVSLAIGTCEAGPDAPPTWSIPERARQLKEIRRFKPPARPE